MAPRIGGYRQQHQRRQTATLGESISISASAAAYEHGNNGWRNGVSISGAAAVTCAAAAKHGGDT